MLDNAAGGAGLMLTTMTARQTTHKKPHCNEIFKFCTAAEGDHRIMPHRLAGVRFGGFQWDTRACFAEPSGNPVLVPSTGTTFLRLCPTELFISHRHKGQVKPEATSTESLFGLRAARTRVLLCIAPQHPHSLSRHLTIALHSTPGAHSLFEHTYILKIGCISFSCNSFFQDIILRCIQTQGATQRDAPTQPQHKGI